MWSTMSVTLEQNQVELGVFCGWETASSQIRICIVLSAIYTTFLAHRAVINESQSLADRVSKKPPFPSFLILFFSPFLLVPQFLSTARVFVVYYWTF